MSMQGKALVASPYLTERNFNRSVVFILRHDEEGAFGLILNRPTTITVGDLMEQFLGHPLKHEAPIYCGGPVEGPLLVLHDRASDNDDSNSSELFSYCEELGLYVASDQETIVDIWKKQDCQYRCFDGYSGWGPGQLEAELKAGGWLIWEPLTEVVFSDPETMWKQAVQEIGRGILATQIDVSRIPSDPAVN